MSEAIRTGRASLVVRRALAFPVLLSGLAVPDLALAGDFSIYLVRQRGPEILIYHEPSPGFKNAAFEAHVSKQACRVTEAARSQRGGDAVATMFVLDRGGTRRSGMGRYGEALVAALRAHLIEDARPNRRDLAGMIDTPGRDRAPGRLEPTAEASAIDIFLNSLPPPSGSGSKVYAVASLALAELDRAKIPLGRLILMSDGIDVGVEAGALDDERHLAREARRRNIPVIALHLDRSRETRGDDESHLRNGRARLLHVASETGGAFETIEATTSGLEGRVREALSRAATSIAGAVRTTCRLCGTAEDEPDARVEISARGDDGFEARSRTAPPVLMSVRGGAFEPCPESACKADEECPEGETCDETGSCTAPSLLLSALVPFAAASLLAMGLFTLFLARRTTRAREPAQFVQPTRATPSKRAISPSPPAPAAPRAPPPEPRRAAASVASVRLVSAPESSEVIDRSLGIGRHLLGADARSAVVFTAPTVSARHAQLDVGVEETWVADLGSSNGTYLNHALLSPHVPVELRHGDLLALSKSVILRIELLRYAEGAASRTELAE